MSTLTYNIIAGLLSVAILYGLSLMSNVKTSVRGNLICAASMGLGILITIYKDGALSSGVIWVSIAIGSGIGLFLSNKVKMIQMPQLVALLNGLGGGAAAIVGLLVLLDTGAPTMFVRSSAGLALVTGMMTLAGALVAAGKLHQVLPQKPIVLQNHDGIIKICIAAMILSVLGITFFPSSALLSNLVMLVSGTLFGCIFTIRVGGADMPITISLLNSLAGVSGAIAGFSIGDPLLVSIGGIVGSAGLLLTRIMCRAMNRKLLDILVGGKSSPKKPATPATQAAKPAAAPAAPAAKKDDVGSLIRNAKNVIIVPGYGMAMAQAQYKVKQLADLLESKGAQVKYAIHPVAGRMPGHMNVLLAEANVDYEQLMEMDVANPLFPDTDLVIIVGANDVVNPAAIEAEGTPIYGMPILRADEAKHVIVCNYDTKPGYAGVENPLYAKEGVVLMLGDAGATFDKLIAEAMQSGDSAAASSGAAGGDDDIAGLFTTAQNIIIVPGYGMAMAQAQHKVKQLADAFEARGANVKYAIHPVAGRMPGHMNVLLAEANVDYEQLMEMDAANPLFPSADLVIIVGANDVVNPAAIEAEGTPIYGMPILRADEAKHVVVCNYDTKPGYAGVENPLYTKDSVTLMLGDAAATLDKLIAYAMGQGGGAAKGSAAGAAKKDDAAALFAGLHRVIIVPGYGMAMAQAQYKVKQLADILEGKGVDVKYAIHPVAGRMPGHMNVLLAEANVDYEQLIEMDAANPLFPDTDLVIIVGANDVVNPAAIEAEGTPIYGMPILRADEAKHIIVCNYDTKPGYAGVENPLYSRDGVVLMLGDAASTLDTLIGYAMNAGTEAAAPAGGGQEASQEAKATDWMVQAKNVIIVPGYGMAMAQAQYKVKQLADAFEAHGASVKYAIHPVAGRMPGHMNVLLAEANVDYEQLIEMDAANPLFPSSDLVIIVGANDVVNPAAIEAEGTPIYGMPILRADEAKHVIVCNFDTKPGYAGVENPLYSKDGVILMLGDAAATMDTLLRDFMAATK